MVWARIPQDRTGTSFGNDIDPMVVQREFLTTHRVEIHPVIGSLMRNGTVGLGLLGQPQEVVKISVPEARYCCQRRILGRPVGVDHKLEWTLVLTYVSDRGSDVQPFLQSVNEFARELGRAIPWS